MNKNTPRQLALIFLNDRIDEIRRLVEIEHYTHREIKELYQSQIYIEDWWVGEFCRQNKIVSTFNRSIRKMGNNNPAKRTEVQEKISNTVKRLWKDGSYDKRINGMLHKKYLQNPNYKMIWGYREKLEYYQPDLICECCGKDLSGMKYDIHHVDEDHNNILLTNLEKLCVPCHQTYHTNNYKQPYVSVEISHEIQYGHRLPNYEGRCYFPHGHRGIITLRIRRRINPKTGFAVDFNELKKIIKVYIDDVLDHEYLNNYMENPTTEFTLVWIWNQLSPHLKGLEAITFAEGSKTSATLTKQDMLEVVLKGSQEVDWIPEEFRSELSPPDPTFSTPISNITEEEFSISTSLEDDPNFSWLYNEIMWMNSPEIRKEINALRKKYGKPLMEEC